MISLEDGEIKCFVFFERIVLWRKCVVVLKFIFWKGEVFDLSLRWLNGLIVFL